MGRSIRNSDALTTIFGSWPSFHDAEVLRVRMDRGTVFEGGPDDGRKPLLDADIHVFETTDEVSEQGVYKLCNHTLVTLGFHGVDRLELTGLDSQNVLFDLEIAETQLEAFNWEVTFVPSTGVAATFVCEDMRSSAPCRSTRLLICPVRSCQG
jgi:hypothetical protein